MINNDLVDKILSNTMRSDCSTYQIESPLILVISPPMSLFITSIVSDLSVS